MMNVITHGYLSSRVPAIDTFEQIIKYAKGHKDVWFARRVIIAPGRGSTTRGMTNCSSRSKSSNRQDDYQSQWVGFPQLAA